MRYADACLWLLGITFILSGMFKWIGIRSFAMTMEQFCDFLGYSPLKGHGRILAVLVCSGELLLGISSFIPRLRWYVRWIFPLVMVYFTYITLLNSIDRYGQIESCGCFGEVIHLSPEESFWKNVVLLAISLLPLISSAWGRIKYKRQLHIQL